MIWLTIAWRNFWRSFARTSFTFSIITIGVIAAILTIGYIKATFFLIKEGTIKGGVGHLQIAYSGEFDDYSDSPLQYGLTSDDRDKIEAYMSSIEWVKQTLPRLSFQGIISNGERSLVFIGEGIEPVAERKLSGSFANTVHGQGLEYGDKENDYRVVIGIKLAKLLGLNTGDIATVMGITIYGGLNAIDVEIAGLVDTGNVAANKLFLRAPLGLAQDLLITDKISRIAVQLKTNSSLEDTLESLVFLEKTSDSGILSFKSWEELSPFYGQLFALYARQFSVLGLILCLVVALSISNSIALSIFERRKSIATLMSIGIPSLFIRRSFLYQGAMLGVLAGVVGIVLSVVLVQIINYADINMPPPPGGNTSYPLLLIFDFGYSLVVLVSTTLLAACISWFSAYRITKINIIESLKYE